jgi:hypothetical protein
MKKTIKINLKGWTVFLGFLLIIADFMVFETIQSISSDRFVKTKLL